MKKQTSTLFTESALASTIKELREFMVGTFATKDDLNNLKDDFNMKLNRLAKKQDVLDMTANIMNSTDEIDTQVQDHEKRLTSLESAKN